MRLRIRGPDGQSTMTLDPEATVGSLLDRIRNELSIANPEIKVGYPPRPFALLEYPREWLLVDIGVKLDNEQLTISNANPPPAAPSEPAKAPENQKLQEILPPPRSARAAPKSTVKDYEMEPPELPLASHSGTLVLRIMPDDNSCMFRALGCAVFGGSLDNMIELRSLVAQSIQTDPDKYNAAILGKNPSVYCTDIQDQDQWGGAIELEILGQSLGVQVCAVDVETSHVYYFNQDPTVERRCILAYSGIHYDTVVLNQSSPPHRSANGDPEDDIRLFPTSDDRIIELAKDLCKVLRARGYFTNPATFEIKCNECGTRMKGEQEAAEHGRKTGHWDMDEVG